MKYSCQKGFSLVEMILVTLIMTGVMIGSAAIFKPILDSWAVAQAQSETGDTIGYALQRMKHEISQIHDKATVITATSTQFRFEDTDYRNINYTISGGNLMRDTQILVRNIQSATFTYYDQNNAVIASPTLSPANTNIWMIKISLSILKNGQTKTMETIVHPRNFLRS